MPDPTPKFQIGGRKCPFCGTYETVSMNDASAFVMWCSCGKVWVNEGLDRAPDTNLVYEFGLK